MARNRSSRLRRRQRNKERREQLLAQVVEVDEKRAARRVFEFTARGGVVIELDFTEETGVVVKVADKSRKP